MAQAIEFKKTCKSRNLVGYHVHCDLAPWMDHLMDHLDEFLQWDRVQDEHTKKFSETFNKKSRQNWSEGGAGRNVYISEDKLQGIKDN